MKCIKFEKEDQYVDDFIGLTYKIYDKQHNMQDDSELRSLLLGSHIFSKYFELDKFCVYRKKEAVGRFIITTYPSDKTAYLGFFECIDDDQVAAFLFLQAEEFARQQGYDRILGPVDASFWLKYRLKINGFDHKPYTGEPYNPSYYLRLFEANGYEVAEHYSSSLYRKVEKNFQNEKYRQRYERLVGQGYRIFSPSAKEWDQVVSELYHLISELYQDFPIYKSISKEDFADYFIKYRQVIDFRMVKMAYYKRTAVGFYISLPNYHNRVYHLSSLSNLLQILWLRKRPKQYVMLYMGVHPEHKGLGKALVQSIIEELRVNGCTGIGALQRKGKVTQHYIEELIEERFEYVLMKKEFHP